MYIHIYTVSTSDGLAVYWFKTETAREELFNDIHYTICGTGDIIQLSDGDETFAEKLILLSVTACGESKLQLLGGDEIIVSHGTSPLTMVQFNELFCIINEKQDSIDSFVHSDKEKGKLIGSKITQLELFGKIHYVTDYIPKSVRHSILKVNMKPETIRNWLNYIQSQSNGNKLMRQSLETLFKSCSNCPETVVTEVEHERLDDKLWIVEIFDLYSSRSIFEDTLLSDAYSYYRNVSERMNHNFLDMRSFSKIVRSLSNYNVRRKARGMVIDVVFISESKKKYMQINPTLSYLDTIRALLKSRNIDYKSETSLLPAAYFMLYNNIKGELKDKYITHFMAHPDCKIALEKYSLDIHDALNANVKMIYAININDFKFPFANQHYSCSTSVGSLQLEAQADDIPYFDPEGPDGSTHLLEDVWKLPTK